MVTGLECQTLVLFTSSSCMASITRVA